MAVDDMRLDGEDRREHSTRPEDDSQAGSKRNRLSRATCLKPLPDGSLERAQQARNNASGISAESSKGHRMSDAIAFLRRAIEQGQGLSQADLVLKGGRIFDLVGGELITR